MFRRILVLCLLLVAAATAVYATPDVEIAPDSKSSILIESDLKIGAAITPGGRSVIQPEDWSATAR